MRNATFLLKFFVLAIAVIGLMLFLSQIRPATTVVHIPSDDKIIDRLRTETQQAQERVSQHINALDSSIGQLSQAAATSQDEIDKLRDCLQQMKQVLAQQILKLQSLEALLEADQGAELPGAVYISPDVILQQAEWERAQYRMRKREVDRLQDRLSHATAYQSSVTERHEAIGRLRDAFVGQREKLREILEHPHLSENQLLLRDSFEFSEIEHDLIANDRTIGQLQSHVQAILDTPSELDILEGH